MKDVSEITTCRAYAIRLAVDYISKHGTQSFSLKTIKSALGLTENQMYTVRREINKQHEKDDGQLKYLHPRDERIVMYIPASEQSPNIVLAVEAAILNLALEKAEESEVKVLLTQFLKNLLHNEVPNTKEKSHA
jgi:hypothetical protein|tara:strand:- start:11545 stop:11946 length:402 start_codon:yes stop_codon:yes gene_type:complete